MIHADTELFAVNSCIGLGVRATTSIPKGTLLWVRDTFDVVIEPQELRQLDSTLAKAARRLGYRDHLGRTILCWDSGKYVNHSCAPSMRGIGPDAMVAIVDLDAGDEVTCDYAECNLEVPFRCACGAENCRGWVGTTVTERQWEQWQRELESALRGTQGLPQPLLSSCCNPFVARVVRGDMPPPSLASVAFAAPVMDGDLT